jgi:hypothetical protein
MQPEVYKCGVCDITFSHEGRFEKHFETKTHERKLKQLEKQKLIQKRKLKLQTNKAFCFVINNRKGEQFTIQVNKEVYDHIIENGYTMYRDKQGYARIYVIIDGKRTLKLLHRYIYYHFYKKPRTKNTVIDHIFGDKLDDRIENLREIDYAGNSRNRLKRKNATSKFYGVSRSRKGVWRCVVKDNDGNVHSFIYLDEIQAAYHYDLLVKEYELVGNLNNIEEPEDFERKELYKKKSGLPKGVLTRRNKFCYTLRGKKYYGYITPEKALIARAEHIEKERLEKNRLILSKPIKRTNNGKAVIELFNRNKEKVAETTVHDDIYYKLMQYPVYLSGKYVLVKVNGKTMKLSRFIMNCTDPEKNVDHKNSDTMNNETENLGVVTPAQNGQNKSSHEGSTSNYVGVSFSKRDKNWVAKIMLEGKTAFYKRFETELQAVHAREEQVIELNKTKGTNFKLNHPPPLGIIAPKVNNKTSDYIGVSFDKNSGLWCGKISFKKVITKETFKDPLKAAQFRDKLAKEYNTKGGKFILNNV